MTTAFAQTHPPTNSFRATPPAKPRIDFRDPAEWITEADVPLIDAHTLTNARGEAEVSIDERFLYEVAANNNHRFERTGDATPGIIGHTTDNPTDPEKPVRCWFTDFKVRPGPDGKPTLYANQHVKRKFANILEDYPRRSVELWVGKREIDPVALLGGTTPERDLGITRYSRQPDGPVLRYSRRSGDHCYHYSLESPMFPANGYGTAPAYPNGFPTYPNHTATAYTANGRPVRYLDDGSGKSEGGPPPGGGDGGDGGEDPMVAKIIASGAFKSAIMSIVQEAIEQAMGGDEPGMDDMGGEGAPPEMAGAGAPMGGPPGMGGPPPMGGPPGMGGPPMPEQEGQGMHAPPPVRFDAGAGYAGGTNTFIPGEARRMSRYEAHMPYPQYGYGPPAAAAPTTDPSVLQRLSRSEKENQSLKLRLARADAAEFVRQLQDTGYLVEDPGYLSEQLANFEFVPNGIAARNEFIEKVVKKNFQRRQADPTSGVTDLMRFSRGPVDAARAAQGPANPEQTQELVRFARANGIGDMAQAWAKMHGSAK